MIVAQVPKEQVVNIWPEAGPLLVQALKTASDKFTDFDLFEQCINGSYVLWIAYDDLDNNKIVCVFTTQILTYPKSRGLAVHWMGGAPHKINDWLGQVTDVLSQYGRDTGCKHIEGYGRDAWLKHLEPYGFAHRYSVFEKDLT